MYKKDRLFIFGDSWAHNIFKADYLINPLSAYLISGIPYHISDFLNEHYNVFNYGEGAVSNSEIFFQLSNLPEYTQGDRVLIIWSHYARFPMWDNSGKVIHYGDFNLPFEDKPGDKSCASADVYASIKGRFYNMLLAEEISIENITNRNLQQELKFYKWIVNIIDRWKPVVVTWEHSLANILNIPCINYSNSIFDNIPASIQDEYNYPDLHLWGAGNYSLYKYLLDLLDDKLTPTPKMYKNTRNIT